MVKTTRKTTNATDEAMECTGAEATSIIKRKT